jgi:hypothetical protein
MKPDFFLLQAVLCMYLVYCDIIIVSPFVRFPLVIALYILQFTASDYPFDIVKLIQNMEIWIKRNNTKEISGRLTGHVIFY